jgi:energy-coupling factor transporter transmembrane protein EcfT
MRTFISPSVVIFGSLVGIVLVFLKPDVNDIFFIGISLIINVVTTKSLEPIAIFIKLSLPIIIPLFIIHTIINPTFPSTNELFGILPFRPEGLAFSIHIMRQVSILFAISTMWFFVDRDYFLDWLISRKFPLFICAAFAQAIAIISLIERRGDSVYKAQQARGIQVGPNLIKKIKALPSVMLPVIATVINETDWRAIALVSRGFTCTKMSSPQVLFLEKFDSLKLTILTIPLLLKITLWKL